jgi:hypothetical protein
MGGFFVLNKPLIREHGQNGVKYCNHKVENIMKPEKTLTVIALGLLVSLLLLANAAEYKLDIKATYK